MSSLSCAEEERERERHTHERVGGPPGPGSFARSLARIAAGGAMAKEKTESVTDS